MTAARRALRGAAGMTARSRSLERMVRRHGYYVVGHRTRMRQTNTEKQKAATRRQSAPVVFIDQ